MRMTACLSCLRRHDRPSEEGQALPVVMSIVLIVVLLSVGLINRVDGDFFNTSLQTKIQQARALAQSGVADALFQIDQQGSSPASFCNEPNSGGKCTLSSIPGAPGDVYTARYNPVTAQYTVLSQGTVKNVAYAVQATVKQTPILLNAVTGGTITFDGNSTSSVTLTDAYGNAIPNGKVGIGVVKGGTLTCNGPGDPNATYNNYGGSISKCTPFMNWGPIYFPQQPSQSCPPPVNTFGAPPTPCMPNLTTGSPAGPTQPCANMSTAGVVTGSDATGYTVAGPATIEPGIYVCRGGLTMTGTVNVDYAQTPLQNSGRIEIFVFPPLGQTTPNPNVSFRGSTVNACEPPVGTGSGTCGAGSPSPAPGSPGLVGDPTDLQIYVSGGGAADLGSSNVNAVFWGPGMSLDLHGSADNLTWTGGLTLGTVSAKGHPAFNLNFDQRLQTEFQETSWVISNYLQTATGFAIP